jgi:hypothetical protein
VKGGKIEHLSQVRTKSRKNGYCNHFEANFSFRQDKILEN